MYRAALRNPADLLRYLQQHAEFRSRNRDLRLRIDQDAGWKELDRMEYAQELLGQYGGADVIPGLERFIAQRLAQRDPQTDWDVAYACLTIERIRLRLQGRHAYVTAMLEWVRRGDKNYQDSCDELGVDTSARVARVRLGAIALGALKAPEAVTVLMEKHKELPLRFDLVRVLAQFEDPSTQELLQREVANFVRTGIIGLAQEVRPLRPGEVGPAWAYWRMRTRGMSLHQTIETLLGALGEDEPRAWADVVLQKIGEPAIPFLIEAVKNPLGKNPEGCRFYAMRILGEMRAKDAVPLLRELLREAVQGGDEKLGNAAAHALGLAGDRSAVPELMEAARRGSWDLQLSALWALGEIGDSRAERLLLELLSSHPDRTIRGSAAEALSKVGTASALPALRERLSAEKDVSVRGRINWAIGEIERRAKRGR